MKKQYKYIATTKEGFIQQLTCYVRHGYIYYVKGRVPVGKDPAATDRKLIEKYGIAKTSGQRFRRKERGLANFQYIRFERDWVMLATPGEKEEWARCEKGNIRNLTRHDQPLIVQGYSIRRVMGEYMLNRDRPAGAAGPARDTKHRVRVQISRQAFRELKAEFLSRAGTRSADWHRMRFYHCGYEPYAPIRQQLLELLHLVNKARATHGHKKLKPDCIRYHRRPVKPFAPVVPGERAA